MKWMFVERAEKLRSRSVRDPFQMRLISQAIQCRFSSDMIHAIGVQRLKQNNNPPKHN